MVVVVRHPAYLEYIHTHVGGVVLWAENRIAGVSIRIDNIDNIELLQKKHNVPIIPGRE